MFKLYYLNNHNEKTYINQNFFTFREANFVREFYVLQDRYRKEDSQLALAYYEKQMAETQAERQSIRHLNGDEHIKAMRKILSDYKEKNPEPPMFRPYISYTNDSIPYFCPLLIEEEK